MVDLTARWNPSMKDAQNMRDKDDCVPWAAIERCTSYLAGMNVDVPQTSIGADVGIGHIECRLVCIAPMVPCFGAVQRSIHQTVRRREIDVSDGRVSRTTNGYKGCDR